jgi:hypothetical protein
LFETRRLWASPGFSVEYVTEGLLKFGLSESGDTDVVKEKGVDDFRFGILD